MFTKYRRERSKRIQGGMIMIKPDYYNMSKPKVDKELRLRKCFRCGKEKKMGKFERYCSIACRNYATKHDTSSFKISW